MSGIQENPIYWDTEKEQMYWIEWYDTGNSEIPTKHYLGARVSYRTGHGDEEAPNRKLNSL